jgi:hypothetical protein
MEGDPQAFGLLASDGNLQWRRRTSGVTAGYEGDLEMTHVRAMLYNYRMQLWDGSQTEDDKVFESGRWWRRRLIRKYFPVISKESLSSGLPV